MTKVFSYFDRRENGREVFTDSRINLQARKIIESVHHGRRKLLVISVPAQSSSNAIKDDKIRNS
jgi:hypothetical protein